METINDSHDSNFGNSQVGIERWRWPLSDEEWQTLQEYLSNSEGGQEKLQIYEQIRESNQIPAFIDADEWERQWHEDLRQAGILNTPSAE